MPQCFQLFRQGSNAPQSFSVVDNAICAYLDVEADADKYVNGWYDYIGFELACGKTFVEIGEGLQRYVVEGRPWALLMLKINHFLLANYTSQAWWEPK